VVAKLFIYLLPPIIIMLACSLARRRSSLAAAEYVRKYEGNKK